jgi:hypothetical protein
MIKSPAGDQPTADGQYLQGNFSGKPFGMCQQPNCQFIGCLLPSFCNFLLFHSPLLGHFTNYFETIYIFYGLYFIELDLFIYPFDLIIQ